MTDDRVCPYCGGDRWRMERLDKIDTRAKVREAAYERLARENGLLSANLGLAKAEGEQLRRVLQRKVQRQARVIRRLEDRLLARGELPHEGVHPSQAAPVSSIPEISE